MRYFGFKGNGDGQFNCPCGVTVDGDDNIYVADGYNHRIQKFTPNGEHISSVGSYGGNQLQFQYPVGITFSSTNSKLYVCDGGNDRIRILDTDLTFSKAFSTQGVGNGQFRDPWMLHSTVKGTCITITIVSRSLLQRAST